MRFTSCKKTQHASASYRNFCNAPRNVHLLSQRLCGSTLAPSGGVTDPLALIREAAASRHEGAALVQIRGVPPLTLLQLSAVSAGELGFVPAMATAESSAELPSSLRHRHALVICGDAAGEQVAIAWLRQLALASPRRHLIIPFAGSQPRPMSEAEEASAACIDDRLSRARRWLRRGRVRSAERWLVAASHAARRRGDAALQAGIDIELARRSHDADRMDEASARLTDYLRPGADWKTYSSAGAIRAALLISRLEWTAASAWLASLATEATLRRAPLPTVVEERVAELDFWRGRGGSVRIDLARSAEQLGWIALGAWSRANNDVAEACSVVLSSGLSADPGTVWWAALVRLLLADDWCGTQRVEEFRAINQQQMSKRAVRLGAALAARACLALNTSDRALDVLNKARGPGPEAAACEELRAIAKGTRLEASGKWKRDLDGLAPGLEFLGSRSTNMHLVDGLTGLLAVIEDAENDEAILAGGCRWVCRQAAASAVAIVSADHATLVVAEGWRRPDLGGEIAAILDGPAGDLRRPAQDSATGSFAISIKYGGVVIGFVVTKGRAADRPAAQQAAMAFAALAGAALRARLDALSAPQRGRDALPELAGQSPLIQAVRESVARAAAAPFPVLIEGESGTGKELVARALHRLSPRRDRKLCAVNCAALTDDLVEAELFGHTRGAFTGAIAPRAGLFEEAHGGTLFLDEVTELSPRAQAKLLRVLQEREIRRVGENTSRPVDVRVIAACNVRLTEVVSTGQFRADLRFRLAVVRINLPPLRDRVEDIPALAQLFWRRAAGEAGTRSALGPDALARLARHAWPGNVRELQNVISGLVVAAPSRGRVGSRHVDQVLAHTPAAPNGASVPLDSARRGFERRMIAAALVRHSGRRGPAATELGLTRQGLTKALRRLGLAHEDDAAGVA